MKHETNFFHLFHDIENTTLKVVKMVKVSSIVSTGLILPFVLYSCSAFNINYLETNAKAAKKILGSTKIDLDENHFAKVARQSLSLLTLTGTMLLSPISHDTDGLFKPPMAIAADYGALTEEQKAVAEAWRIVDNNFLDRTFNGQDWFKVRQDAVLKHKYKNMDEARQGIDSIVGSLGDKYTRYLPPAKYRSIVDAATGTLAGVGCEISTNKDTNKIYASDVEPSSPAARGKMTMINHLEFS